MTQIPQKGIHFLNDFFFFSLEKKMETQIAFTLYIEKMLLTLLLTICF